MKQLLIDWPRIAPLLVMVVSLVALGGAYASELWGGLEPCVLCYYQRYVYGVAFAVGLVGLALGGNVPLLRLCMILAGIVFLVGAAIAVFHVGVEQKWWRGTAECHAPVLDPNMSAQDLRAQLLGKQFVPCDEVQWSLFGISMAGYNVIASLVLTLASLWAVGVLGRRQKA